MSKIIHSKSLIVKIILLFTFYFSNFGFVLATHTFHTTLTRIDYNNSEKLAEITIQMFPHDILPTLEKLHDKKIDLENTKDIDKLIFDYLNEKFVLKNKNGEVKKLVWVGKEVEVDTIFVYVQTEMPEGLLNSQLKNSLFFESFAEQSNLVICKFDNKKADLAFKVGDKFKEIIENKN